VKSVFHRLVGVALVLWPLVSSAWESNRLLIWINGDKGYQGIAEIGRAFENNTGIPVDVEHPEGATDKFFHAAKSGKGPDVMIWAHDRLGEWADTGLLMPVDPSPEFLARVSQKRWTPLPTAESYGAIPSPWKPRV